MISKFQAGTQPSASHLNQLVDVANALTSIVGSEFVTVNRGPGGISLGLNIGLLQQRLGRPYFAFPVKVEKYSGSSGSASTECSYTYTVKDVLGNTTYATEVT